MSHQRIGSFLILNPFVFPKKEGLVSNPRQQKNSIKYLQLFKGMKRLFQNPENTDSVFEISDSLKNANSTKVALDYIKQNDSVRLILKERYLGPDWTIEELASSPEGSVGLALYDFLTRQNFSPDTFRKPPRIADDIDYVEFRLRKTHDAWHVVGNFKTDVVGELGIQAFRFAQVQLPLSVILIAGGLIRLLRSSPELLPNAMSEISRGWILGRQSQPLIGFRWEQNWNRSLKEVKSELGL